ncbi:MAG: hypothetical protein ACREFL_20940 [Stellaceae bacterium]
MITDDELSGLPEDPELAFVEFERIMRARLHEKEYEASQEQWGDADPYRLEYINRVLAAARVYNVDQLKGWEVPSVEGNVSNVYRQFSTDVDHFTTQIRIRNVARNRQGSVGLDGNTKAKIHHHIAQIRTAIEEAALPDDKRDALYGKLDRFALEVDKARTSLQAGMAVYIAVCAGIGEGFKKLEPVRRMVDSVATLLGRAKEAEDALPALPAATDRRNLEAPRRRLPSPATRQDPDDEIPF